MPITMTMKRYRISESYTQPKLRVDREKGVIYGVKALGIESKNGRTYSEAARQDQAKLIEGMAVAFGHDRDDPGRERGFGEQPAVIRNVTVESDGNFGDLHVFKSHPSAELLMDRAEQAPETFGLSHVAECELSGGDKPGFTIVENISKIHTLDIVTRPATTDGLFESIDEPAGEVKIVKTTLFEAIKTKYPKTAQRVLLEMDEMGVDTLDVELDDAVAGGSDPAQAVADALADKATEIFLDDSIDPKETGKQIGELAKAVVDVKSKLEGTAAAEPAAEAEDDEEESSADEEKVAAESIGQRMARMFARDESRSIVESSGMMWVDVPVDIQNRMIAAKTDTDRVTVFESLTPAEQGAEKPAVGRRTLSESYDPEAFIASQK